MSGSSEFAFDQLAQSYDEVFSGNQLGIYYRRRMWQIMSRLWPGQQSLLELNAGTGEDALFLAERGNQVMATDRSRDMLAQIEKKRQTSAHSKRLTTRQLSFEQLDLLHEERFDGVLSNFGGLNCIADHEQFAANLAPLVKPGGYVCLCLMGPLVPWEWAWYLWHREPRKSVRRLSGRAEWRGISIAYPSAAALIKSMKPHGFRCTEKHAVGLLMPPTYASAIVEACPGTFRTLGNIERKIAQLPTLYRLADHYALVFEKI